ncbi:Zinc finger protein [Apis mellifera caucasica]|nr:Zinc finger protein [Apis mellifera caucasica]
MNFKGSCSRNRYSSPKPFPCDKCDRAYKNKSSLTRHQIVECGKLPQFICRTCNKGFKQKGNFQRHNSKIHGHIFLLGSAKIDGEEHRKSSIQEAAGDSQVHEMREGLSIGDLASKASKARVRGRAEAELPNLREKVHAQVQIDPPLGLVQKKAGILRDDIKVDRSPPHPAPYIYIYVYIYLLGSLVFHQKTKISLDLLDRQIRKEIDDDKNFPKKRLLATMLLSQDVQQPQDNNEPLWNQLPYPGIRGYEASRSQRRKDSKDAGSKYACNRCGKTYKATTSLSRHKRLECGVIPCEVCPICDRRFKHRFVLNSHIVGCQRKLRHIIQKNDDSPVFTEERE